MILVKLRRPEYKLLEGKLARKFRDPDLSYPLNLTNAW